MIIWEDVGIIESSGYSSTTLLMGETVMLSRILACFFEWWNTFYPIWLWQIIAVVTFMLLVVWSYNGMEGGIHYVARPRIPISIMKVKNPFTMRLDHSSTSFPGVRCTLSTKKFCYVLPFWGVQADEFFKLMEMNWSSMKYTLLENADDTLRNNCVASDPITRLNAEEEKSFVFVPPQAVYFDQRMCHDFCIPLVVFMLFMEDLIENEEPFIFVQAVVIKVPAITISVEERSDNSESSFPANSSRVPEVHGVYMRDSSSPSLGVMQRAYDGSLYSENVNGVEVPVCVTCSQRAVNTVTFPCLHASLCSLCLQRCDTCPCCRGPMYNYFPIGPLTEIPQE